ncbi:MAG: hypothetical protein ABSE59_01710 [Opitutaceae bacterium]|jgi:hypothetical protein
MNNSADGFNYPGLYLLTHDGRRILLTQEKIDSFAKNFEANLHRFPIEVRCAVNFKPCAVCPEKDAAVFCHALPAALTFFEELKDFKSDDRADAFYSDSPRSHICVRNITMQEALQFVVLMSLLKGCEVGRKYARYFTGIHPLMETSELLARLDLNIYWDCKGNRGKIEKERREFASEISCVSECQVKRLRLVCENDALVNAFARTQEQIERLVSSSGSEWAKS